MRFAFKKPTHIQLTKTIYSSLTILVSVLYFLLCLDAVFRFIRVRSGFTSWIALMSLLAIGIGELTFALLSTEMYKKLEQSRELLTRFLSIITIFGWLFAALQVFGIWTYVPDPSQWLTYAQGIWSTGDVITFFAGITVGIVTPIVRLILIKRRRDE